MRLWLLLIPALGLCAACHKVEERIVPVGTPAERAWLATNGHLLVYAPDPDYPPYEYYEVRDGQTCGMAREFLEAVEKRLGVRFKKKQVSDFASILELAKNGEVAIVNAVTRTPERSRYLEFTGPVHLYDNVILVRHGFEGKLSMDDLAGKTVSFVQGYAVAEHCRSAYPGVVQNLVPSDLHALLNVSYGITEYAVIDMASASWLIRKHGIQNLRVAGNAGYPVALAIGVRKALPVLYSLVSKAVDAVSDDERNAINSRWVRLENDSVIQPWILVTGFGILFMLVLIVIWNRLLRFQVRRKTRELQAAMNRLESSELRLRLQLDNALDAILVEDVDLKRFIEVNTRAVEMFGYTREEFAGFGSETLYRLSPSDDNELTGSIADNRAKVLEGARLVFTRVVTRKDGQELWCEVRAQRVPFGERRLVRLSYLDKTLEHAAEEKHKKTEIMLLQRQKLSAVGTLANGIAHEINNPLMGIINYGQLILDRTVSAEAFVKDYAAEIISEGTRIAGIVQSLLSFSRQQQDHKESVSAVSLFESIRTLAATIFGKDEISIDFSDEDGLTDLVCTPGRIQQVLLNLITNARDALNERYPGYDPEKTIRVSVCRIILENLKTWARFSVEDHGFGVPEKDREKLFEPFYTTKPVGSGTGLGLPICYGIIAEHNGRIWYEDGKDGGARFCFDIPL